ncbi:MAG TPA: M50 family metallopeptidase [Candidatus Angelobacter sp.]
MILWIVYPFLIGGCAVLFQLDSRFDTSSSSPADQLSRFLNAAFAKIFPTDLSGFQLLLPFLYAWLALFMAIAVHELGHMLAGWSARFRLTSMQLGPIQITRSFQIKWRPGGRLPGAMGLVRMVPTDAGKLRMHAIIMLLGGPSANLLTAFLLVFLSPWHGLFATWFFLMSVFTGLFNLLPLRNKAVLSDGKRILMLLRNSRHGERWLALLRLNADIASGVDPEKLNPQFLAMAVAIEDESPDTVNAHVLAFASAYGKHDDPEAARLLEVCLRHSGRVWPALREAAFLNAAIFQAERRKRADLAEQWLADLPEKSLFPQNRLNAQGAILQSRGDIAGALKKLDESEAMVLHMAPSPKKEAALRALQKWRAELLEQTSSQA